MIKTTHTCDRCGHEQASDTERLAQGKFSDEARQFWTVSLSVDHGVSPGRQRGAPSMAYPKMTAHWCRQCVVETGAYDMEAEGVEKPETPPTLEEIIYEIATEAAADVVAAG